MKNKNRRVAPRHVLSNNSLIICKEGSGEIIDISKTGLSFTPLTFKTWPKKPFNIDLILNLPESTILDVNCTIIYPSTPDTKRPARCGISFNNLSTEQSNLLEDFCNSL